MMDKLKKKIGLTRNFLNRKKKKGFTLIGYIRWVFRNYGKAKEAEYNPHAKRYLKVKE